MTERESESSFEGQGRSSRGRFHNPTVRQLMYDALRHCYSGKCAICGISETEKELVIDHIDGNPLNWHFENLRLLCKKHNATEYWRMIKKFNKIEDDTIAPFESVSVKMGEGGKQVEAERSATLISGELETSTELKVNRVKEPLYRNWVMERLIMAESMTVKDAIYAGSEKWEISPVTARRYLEKMCSAEGYVVVVGSRKTVGGYTLKIRSEYWEKLSSSPK